jgi:hypothetical protein
VFENVALRRIFGSGRDEVTGEWKKIHSEELYDLYSLPSIVRLIISSRMRWGEHVASMGESGILYRLGWRNLRERDTCKT